MIGKDIAKAKALLEGGQLVAIPTETVYGLAANALDEQAVSQIFAVKNRPSFDPLIIHTSAFERVSTYVQNVPKQASVLAEAFLPGPLTFLLPKKTIIPALVTAGSSLVAVRIPRHPMTLELLQGLDFPLAAPSANPFGYISPTEPKHVAQQLGRKIPYILDGGKCTIGLESTIIGFPDGQATIFRKGGIAIEAIEEIIGKVTIRPHSTSNPSAPGMLKSHYAPRIPLTVGNITALLPQHEGKKVGIISFRKSYLNIPSHHQLVLSPTGDFAEAARNLFAGMRRLDNQALDIILAELLPERDLGRAINDRLRRAAVR